jgi:oxygen-independent coproporphyrinogen-3 oxidase
MTFASRHNQKYWDHTPYLGLGPAAHSFHGNQRWWNHRSLEKYIMSLKESEFPVEGTETLTMEQLALESLYLGLRTKTGVNLEEISNQVGEGVIARLLGEELLRIQDGFLRPTRSGLAVADGLTALFASSLRS